ncbi:MAG TPA: hypothetical protein VFE27_18325, partial [Acidobacteriaceae bacterium]|nr:hypothetical protein [Acidobacteriaceae bacterium]
GLPIGAGLKPYSSKYPSRNRTAEPPVSSFLHNPNFVQAARRVNSFGSSFSYIFPGWDARE